MSRAWGQAASSTSASQRSIHARASACFSQNRSTVLHSSQFGNHLPGAGTSSGSVPEVLPRQRIGPELQLDRLGPVLLAAFEMEVGARARGGPQAAAFPAGALVVDAPIDVLRE